MPKRIGLVVITAVILVAAGFMVSWGLADASAQRAYDVMDTWRGEVSRESWMDARAHVEHALALNPYHPVYHQRLARLYRLSAQGLIAPPTGVDTSDALDLARHHLERSLQLRPRWPYAIAEMLLTLDQSLAPDEETLNRYLLDAIRFGPYDPFVLQNVPSIGLRHYAFLDEDVQTGIVDLIINGMITRTRDVRQGADELMASSFMVKLMVAERLPARRSERDWEKPELDRFERICELLLAPSPDLQDLDEDQQARMHEALDGLVMQAGCAQ